MSPRRKQSTKDLGAILSEAVPVVVAEEVQLPAGSPPPHPAEAEAAVEAETDGEPQAAAASLETEAAVVTEAEAGKTEEQPAAASEEPAGEPPTPEAAVLAVAQTGGPGGAAAQPGATVEALAAPVSVTEAGAGERVAEETEPVLGSRPQLRTGTVAEALSVEAAPVLWRKSTIPFREDQYAEIGHVLADFYLRHDVQLTIAEVVRLGLDKMIEALREPALREAILADLYRQQRRESEGNENLKHSKSRGLGEYLAARGRLPAG